MSVCGVVLTGCGGSGDSTTNTEQAETAQQTQESVKEEQTSVESEQSVGTLAYEFSGKDADKAGYAEGTITFTAPAEGTYNLYWSDDEGALDGYYEIAQMEYASSLTFKFIAEECFSQK